MVSWYFYLHLHFMCVLTKLVFPLSRFELSLIVYGGDGPRTDRVSPLYEEEEEEEEDR